MARASWHSSNKQLKQRGLAGVRLIVSDACLGLVEAAGEAFAQAAWQRCVVHWYRLERNPGTCRCSAALQDNYEGPQRRDASDNRSWIIVSGNNSPLSA